MFFDSSVLFTKLKSTVKCQKGLSAYKIYRLIVSSGAQQSKYLNISFKHKLFYVNMPEVLKGGKNLTG